MSLSTKIARRKATSSAPSPNTLTVPWLGINTLPHRKTSAPVKCSRYAELPQKPEFNSSFQHDSSQYGGPGGGTGYIADQKRLIRKQRYLGSVELLISVDNNGKIRNMGRFRKEPGDVRPPGQRQSVLSSSTLVNNCLAPLITSPPSSPVILENPEIETRWYFKHFLGREHQNFAGLGADKQPFFFSTVVDDSFYDGGLLHHRAILWTNKGAKRLCLPYNSKGNSTKALLKNFPTMRDQEQALKEISDPRIQKDLLVLEEQEGSVNFKFGVIYSKAGQETDYEMLSNKTGDESFDAFVQLLGDEVTLQGWDRYKGGLDVKTNTTGDSSVYTVFEGHEIMFHVASYLPHSTVNKQQIERKRHIGNDIVNVIFEDTDDPENPTFKPSMMKSQFTHIFALVTYNPSLHAYHLWVFSEESVPLFGPALPSPSVFHDALEFREFLLTKLINGEKAAFNSQVFAEKRHRTIDLLIKDMYIEYLKDYHKPLSKVDSVRSRTRSAKKDERHLEFIKFGQSLKLEHVLSGDAPNSLVMTGFCRKQPWEPVALNYPVSWNCVAGDAWGSFSMLLAPEAGGLVFVSAESSTVTQVIDRSLSVRQVVVFESYGIVVIKTVEKGREGNVYVFKLSSIYSLLRQGLYYDRATCKANRVDYAKGCSIMAVSHGLHLRLHIAVCVGHHVKVLQWKYSVPCPDWCLADSNLPANFELIQDLSLSDDPIVLSLFEDQCLRLCVGYKYQFDLIPVKKPEKPETLCRCETKACNAFLTDSCDEDQSEILITYNNTTTIFDITTQPSTSINIYWNSTPSAIVYIFPYVLAFTSDTIEIRLAINGSLVATNFLPRLQLISSKADIYFISASVRLGTPPSAKMSPESGSVFSMLYNSARGSSNASSPIESPPEATFKLHKIPVAQLLGLNTGPTGSLGNSSSSIALPGNVTARLRPINGNGNHAMLCPQRSNPSNSCISLGGAGSQCLHAEAETRNSLSPSSAVFRKVYAYQDIEKSANRYSTGILGSDLSIPSSLTKTATLRSASQSLAAKNNVNNHVIAHKTASAKSDSGISSQGSLDYQVGPGSVPQTPYSDHSVAPSLDTVGSGAANNSIIVAPRCDHRTSDS